MRNLNVVQKTEKHKNSKYIMLQSLSQIRNINIQMICLFEKVKKKMQSILFSQDLIFF